VPWRGPLRRRPGLRAARGVEGIDADGLKELWSDLRGRAATAIDGHRFEALPGAWKRACDSPWIGEDHPLSNIAGEWNALAITLATGETTVVTGRGAGRWPTTEAIIADLLELRRECQLKVIEHSRHRES